MEPNISTNPTPIPPTPTQPQAPVVPTTPLQPPAAVPPPPTTTISTSTPQPEPVTTTPQPLQPFESKKSFNPKTLILIIGLILLAIILSGVAFFLGQKSVPAIGKTKVSSMPTVAAALPILTIIPTISPASAVTDTATWKTYSNQYLSFNYPANWKIADPYQNTPDQSTYIGVLPSSKTVGSSVTPIVITRIDNPNNLTLQQWQDERSTESAMAISYYTSTTQTTTINGHTAYVNEKGDCEPLLCYQVFIAGKNNLFKFENVDLSSTAFPNTPESQTYTKTDIQANQQILNQLLTTVKFTQ